MLDYKQRLDSIMLQLQEIIDEEYEDNDSGETFWGVDVTDHTRGEGYEERRVLLFKGDNPQRIEKILNSEIHHDFSDEAYMDDDYEKKWGQFSADKVIKM